MPFRPTRLSNFTCRLFRAKEWKVQMRADRAEVAVTRDAVAGVGAMAECLVASMDPAGMEVILAQSAGFLQVGAPGAVTTAVARLLRTPRGVKLIDDIRRQIEGAIEMSLVDELAAAFSDRICAEMGIEPDLRAPQTELLEMARSTSTG